MKLKEYLIDKRYLIMFYIILMSFISAVIYLDNTVKVRVDNILYINAVSFIFFLIYIFSRYFFNRRYYLSITDIIRNQNEDIINFLPEPKTYEQTMYNELIKKIYDEQNMKIENLYKEKKENQDFVTSWVHEIKTPITVSRLIMENSIGKSQEEVLDSLEDELDKIDNYVEQSLYYSRIDAFSKDYFISEIDMNKTVMSVIKKHAKIFISKKIKFEINETKLNVATDKKWITFIISQILSNALKYTSEGGKIVINFEKSDKERRIVITDNGIGIKSEDIVRVFDKGFTGYTGRKDNQSTGMGLYLARKLSKKLGHDITIESVYGEGTKVTIHFPKLTDYFSI